MRYLVVAVLLGLTLPTGCIAADGPSDGVPSGPRLRDFAGAVNVPGAELWRTLSVGWGRQDFSWSEIEPAQDDWHFDKFDAMILGVHENGFELLPILCYTVGWAAPVDPETNCPVVSVPDWEDYVETVVGRYVKPPFNVRYFQVWNEPTRKAGFWKGRTDGEFFERIYVPAAKIIKRLGGQVVFGGWPCSDGIDAFTQLFEEYEAWRWTDILDIHYYGFGDMVRLHEMYVKTGKCRGVWQTEVGWHPFEEYLPNLYCRTLYWGLKQNWDFPDKFKLFWYAFWGPGPVANKCLTCPGPDGNVPSPTHGVRMRALSQVLGGGTLAAFDEYTIEPALPFTIDEETESSQGFRCGDKTVIAFQVSPETQAAHPALAIKLPTARRPRRVARYTSTGQMMTQPYDYADGVATVWVRISDMEAGTARNWGRRIKYVVGYVVIE